MAGSAMDNGSVVTEECLQELLDFFFKNAYKAKNVDRRYEIIHKRCIHMVGRDYKIEIIDNKMGQLCAHYPSELIVIERELEEGEPIVRSKRGCVNSASQLRELIPSARFARCRSRFVVPVILYENKNICRSSTLSSMAELYGRSGFDWILALPTIGVDLEDRDQSSANKVQGSFDLRNGDDQTDSNATESDWVLLSKVRGQDVQLLKALGVSLICDLMVEKKKLKYGLYVCSSEKVDKWARYADFHIASMPYPGCEFFKDYKDNGYNAVSLKFDWKQTFVDADLTVPKDLEGAVERPYKDYKEWDLIEMTQNYLKMLLQYLVECEGGILIHCISGWDRTPLYISLLRLSLWADGKVHRSLTPAEMLYFTLAYDWLIYGHQLKERHDKGEEVMYFCFDFLKYMLTDDFSVLNRLPKSSRTNATPTRTSATPTRTSATPTRTNATPTRTSATPTRTLSTEADKGCCSNGGSRVAGSGGLRGFDISPTPLSSSYELGESWVGVESSSHDHTPSSSLGYSSTAAADSAPLPPECQCHLTGSLQQKVALDCLNQRCKFYNGQPDHSRSQSSSPGSGGTERARRLNCVRELFLKTFRNSIPESTESSPGGGGPLAGLTGFLSKLASSVVNANNTSI